MYGYWVSDGALCVATCCFRYTIITYTSDIRGAGTDANVSCMLMGDKANTPTFMLENSANK